MSDPDPLRDLVWSLGTPCDPSALPELSAMEMLWVTGKQAVAKAVAQTHPKRSGANGDVVDPDELSGEGELGSGEHLYALIFMEPVCNAVAAGAAGGLVIGVYHGLAMVIPELVIWIFGSASFLPGIGEVARLPRAPNAEVPLGLQMLRSIALRRLDEDIDNRSLPANRRALESLHHATDQVRHAAAAYTIASAFRFTWMHEASHVLLGHVDAMNADFGLSAFPEAANDGDDAQVPVAVSQVLELQADSLALDVVIAEEFDRLKSAVAKGQADRAIRAGQPQTPMTPRQAAVAVVLGCLLVPLVLHAQLAFRGEAETISTHPPLWFRAELALRRAREVWGHDQDAAGLADLLRDAMRDLAQLHPLLAGWFGQLDGPSHDARCEDYLKSLGVAYEASGGISLKHKSHPSRHVR